MALIIIFLVGFLVGVGLFVWLLVGGDALGVYRKSVVTDYLVEQQAHERHNNELLMSRYDTIVSHQNKIIQLQNESPTLLAYLHELKQSHCETGVNHISQLKSGNDIAEKIGLKIKDNDTLTIRKSTYNTLLISEGENYIADVTIAEIQEMSENKMLISENPAIYLVRCVTCGTYFPSKSSTAATCSVNCRKQKSLNRF